MSYCFPHNTNACQGLSLCIMCLDQHVNDLMPHVFPLTSSLLKWLFVEPVANENS